MTADAEATLRAAANRLVELEAENARLQEQWTNFLGDQHMLVKSGQAVTADGVVCDLERRTVDSWLTDTYRLRPVVDLPEGGTS